MSQLTFKSFCRRIEEAEEVMSFILNPDPNRFEPYTAEEQKELIGRLEGLINKVMLLSIKMAEEVK